MPDITQDVYPPTSFLPRGRWSLSVTRNWRLAFRIDTAQQETCDMDF
jgi:hypothetical protein